MSEANDSASVAHAESNAPTTVEAMLTTVDNPHDPFDDFAPWYRWDEAKGYHSSSFLARILIDSDALSEPDYNLAVEMAIDEIVRENVSGMHKKVTRTVTVGS